MQKKTYLCSKLRKYDGELWCYKRVFQSLNKKKMAEKTKIEKYKKSDSQSDYEKRTFVSPILKLVPKAESGRQRKITLPKYISFTLQKDKKKLLLNIEEQIGICKGKEVVLNATCNNMQTDNAAFEGWAICLKAWFPKDIETVKLSWDIPHDIKADDNRWCHYRRFVYRVLRFSEQYKWFDVSEKNRSEIYKFKQELKELKNNNFKEVPKPKVNNNRLDETTVEYILSTTLSDDVKRQFNLDFIDRQFPVGVKSGGKKFFTSNKSAIDLWGSKDNVLTIIELKYIPKGSKNKNIKVGIISELFMYSCIMRDILSGFICRPEQTPNKNEKTFYQQIDKYKNIKACMLANEYHPLVENDSVIEILNDYLKVNNQISVDFKKSRYSLDSENKINFL